MQQQGVGSLFSLPIGVQDVDVARLRRMGTGLRSVDDPGPVRRPRELCRERPTAQRVDVAGAQWAVHALADGLGVGEAAGLDLGGEGGVHVLEELQHLGMPVERQVIGDQVYVMLEKGF